jgi:hypothetical protein
MCAESHLAVVPVVSAAGTLLFPTVMNTAAALFGPETWIAWSDPNGGKLQTARLKK